MAQTLKGEAVKGLVPETFKVGAAICQQSQF